MSDDVYRNPDRRYHNDIPPRNTLGSSALPSRSHNVTAPPTLSLGAGQDFQPSTAPGQEHRSSTQGHSTYRSQHYDYTQSRTKVPAPQAAVWPTLPNTPGQAWQGGVASASSPLYRPDGYNNRATPRAMEGSSARNGGGQALNVQNTFNVRQSESQPHARSDPRRASHSQATRPSDVAFPPAASSLDRSRPLSSNPSYSNHNHDHPQRRDSVAAANNNYTSYAGPPQRHERRLDPSYKQPRCPRKYFVVGRVFLMVWSEPGQNDADTASSCWTRDSYGQWIYTKPRRFIVVRSDPPSCLVVPINSYGGQGVHKWDVKKSDHCIVYTGRVAPQPSPFEVPGPQEQGMQPYAIRIAPDERDAKLDEMSRIDYSRPRTIDHYNLVKNFGKVHPDSMPFLISQFQNVMDPSRVPAPLPASGPSALDSSRSRHLRAHGALMRDGFTQQEATEYVNDAIRGVRARRDARSGAEESQSESEYGGESDGAR